MLLGMKLLLPAGLGWWKIRHNMQGSLAKNILHLSSRDCEYIVPVLITDDWIHW